MYVTGGVDLSHGMTGMSNLTPGAPDASVPRDSREDASERPIRRRRGRRGGRRRKSEPMSNAAAAALGMMNPPEPPWADEQAVSDQLRLLMAPRGKPESQGAASGAVSDPQLSYTPPVSIESHETKANAEQVSAKSFNRAESPLQAVVATVGSMAILAALYHFGYWEGSQVQVESPQLASVSAPPEMSAAPDPLQLPPVVEPAVEPAAATPAEEAEPTPSPAPGAGAAVSEAAAPKATPIPAVAQPRSPSGLYLQVAALKDPAAARGLESRLRAAGYSVEVFEALDDGLVRVISGPYAEMTEARSISNEMVGLGLRPFPRRF